MKIEWEWIIGEETLDLRWTRNGFQWKGADFTELEVRALVAQLEVALIEKEMEVEIPDAD